MLNNTKKGGKLWSIDDKDKRSFFIIAILPIIIALPQLFGWLKADPMIYTGNMVENYQSGLFPGVPFIDPNNGFTTQALGYRSAKDWLDGIVPWWNYYSGVGLPLAAEFQPATFFPLTFLLLFPNGIVWQHILLQIIAGLGTYALLRQLGLSRLTALAGGILFSFNGTLAWFDHASALPVPFLPLMLWGIERAYTKVKLGLNGGWRIFALSLAMGLLAGFPETTYINGLMTLIWTILRFTQTTPNKRVAFTKRVVLGGVVGIALALPQILAFFSFLPHAFLGNHSGGFANTSLTTETFFQSLFAPYIFGPPATYSNIWLSLGPIWGSVGGYTTAAILIMAIYGVLSCRSSLLITLTIWVFLVLGKTFGFHIISFLWNLLPGIKETAFFRYATPSWELSLIILASFGIENLVSPKNISKHWAKWGTSAIAVFLIGGFLIHTRYLWPNFANSVGLKNWAISSISWALIVTFFCLFSIFFAKKYSWLIPTLITLLIIDSIVMFAIPTLINPRKGEIDLPAIDFLQKNLGLQRFYTLGPIAPNYGAYFGIASINYNYSPVAKNWTDWAQSHLDSSLDPFMLTGNDPRQTPHQSDQAYELRKNLSNYGWIGVKYIVAPSDKNPFIETLATQTEAIGNRPIALESGQSISGMIPASVSSKNAKINSIGVFQGNYGNTAKGFLEITLCSGKNCVSGKKNLAESRDNSVFNLPLSENFEILKNMPIKYTVNYTGETGTALWMFPTKPNETQNLVSTVDSYPNMGLQLYLGIDDNKVPPKKVYQDDLMAIYKLSDYKPYFELLGSNSSCSINEISRTEVVANCSQSDTLIRRELFFPGWKASINGKDVKISIYKEIFQTINLNRGKNIIRFKYSPPNILWAWTIFWIAIIFLLASVFRPLKKVSFQKLFF